MKITRREFLTTIGIGSASIVGGGVVLDKYPITQKYKRTCFPFLSLQEKYHLPTSQEEKNVTPLKKEVIHNDREELEDKIAELFITLSNNINTYTPGGVLLSVNETRRGHLFGKFNSYDPERTQESVKDIIAYGKKNQKRILIYDEGEGGYVMRVGGLPAAADIGIYYTQNKIRETMKDRVIVARSQDKRLEQIEKLFEEYAHELHNRGINVVLGPCLDVVSKSNEENLIANGLRNFHFTHEVTRELADKYISAMKKHSIKTIGKHFLTAGLTEEDPHDEEAHNPQNPKKLAWAIHTYQLFKDSLDGIMMTHVTNPTDTNRPYSVSKRAYEILTKNQYPTKNSNAQSCFLNNRFFEKKFPGVGFNGLVMVDELSMNGLTVYLEKESLSKRGERITAHCDTIEAKAAIIALDQGANVFISRSQSIDPIVQAIKYAYHIDNIFKKKVDTALRKYQQFTRT